MNSEWMDFAYFKIKQTYIIYRYLFQYSNYYKKPSYLKEKLKNLTSKPISLIQNFHTKTKFFFHKTSKIQTFNTLTTRTYRNEPLDTLLTCIGFSFSPQVGRSGRPPLASLSRAKIDSFVFFSLLFIFSTIFYFVFPLCRVSCQPFAGPPPR